MKKILVIGGAICAMGIGAAMAENLPDGFALKHTDETTLLEAQMDFCGSYGQVVGSLLNLRLANQPLPRLQRIDQGKALEVLAPMIEPMPDDIEREMRMMVIRTYKQSLTNTSLDWNRDKSMAYLSRIIAEETAYCLINISTLEGWKEVTPETLKQLNGG